MVRFLHGSQKDCSMKKLLLSNDRIKLELSKIPLKQDKATYKHGPIVNIYFVSELISSAISIGITLHNCLFGTVNLKKKILILISTNIPDMVLDLIQEEVFHT